MRNNVKININNIKSVNRKILYSSVKEITDNSGEYRVFLFTCSLPHGLETNNSVSLHLEKHPYLPVDFNFHIVKRDIYTFEIQIPLYHYFIMSNYGTTIELIREKDEEGNVYERSEYVGDANLFLENDTILKYINDYHNITVQYYDIQTKGYMIYDSLGEYDDDEHPHWHYIYCDRPLPFTSESTVGVLLEWYLTKDNKFNTEIEIFESAANISIPVLFTNREVNNLRDEQDTLKQYLKDVQNSILPESIDNEKRQFSPTIKISNNGKILYSFADKITFNLHFRDRYDLDNPNVLRDGWSTSDLQFWNGMGVSYGNDGDTEKDDTLYYTTVGYNDSMGDELNHLGFTEDDIRFSKTKLKKSFIRLLFYSDKNLLSKQLLYYSTIFLDTNTLFKKYINIKERGYECFDKQRIDETLRLSCQFVVNNKYNLSKSSEGFYLYLFPNEIIENQPTTIYMKVEFNHAGYGKTIPLMLPRDDNDNIINSSSSKFPINFMINQNGLDTDFHKYQDNVMIPIEISYNKELGEYIYNFPFIKNQNKDIVLNLFEPRIRGLETNGNN